MSAEWFCKIGDKKIGPLSGQQLKAIVVKGKLLPEHLVSRGTDGQWVPAGRVKGLFPEKSSEASDPKPAASAEKPSKDSAASTPAKAASDKKPADRPVAKSAKLPATKEAPEPPASDLPPEFSLGSANKKKHHVGLDVSKLEIKAQPVKISGRKTKGMPGMNQKQQKKMTLILLGVIGGGLVIAVTVFTWAAAVGLFSSQAIPEKKQTKAEPTKLEQQAEADKAAEAAKTAEKAKAKKETGGSEWPEGLEAVKVGDVEFKVTRLRRGAPPSGAKIEGDAKDVLVLPIMLHNFAGKKAVDFKGWGGAAGKSVSLKDDSKEACKFLGVSEPKDTKSIDPEKRIQVELIFAPPAKKVKYLHLELPSAAAGGDKMMKFTIPGDSIPGGDAKAEKK